MKVLISAYACDPEGGSEPHNGWFTAEAVASEGHEVTLLTTPAKRASIQAYIAANPRFRSINVVFLANHGFGVGYHRVIGVYGDYIQWQRKVKAWVSSSDSSWDVAHHVTYGSIILPCGLTNIEAPLVFGPVGGGQIMNRAHYSWAAGSHTRERIRSTLVRLMRFNPSARKNVRSAGLVLVVNLETDRRIRTLGRTQTRMAMADSIPDHEIETIPRDKATRGANILWVGRFYPIKAAHLALEAFAIVAQELPSASLTFIGDGVTRASVSQLSEQLGLRDRVMFTGMIPHAEVQVAYSNAAAMLFSSVRDSFGAQVLEAAAKGCPVIGLDQSGFGYWYPPEAGRKVAPTPSSTLVARLAAAMTDVLSCTPERWAEASLASIQWASEMTWTAKGRQLSNAYSEVMTRSQ